MPRVLLTFQENNKERKTNIHIYTSNYEDTPYLIKEFIYGHLIFSSGFGWSYTNTVSHENIYNYLNWIPFKRIFFSIFGEIHCNQLVSVFMYWVELKKDSSTCDALRDFVPFVQFVQERENTHGGVLLLVNLQTDGLVLLLVKFKPFSNVF